MPLLTIGIIFISSTISLVTTATTLIFPLNINGFSGSIHSQEVNKKLEFTLDISAERLKSSQSLNLKFEVKKAPFRYGYESDPCRAISYFDTWWSTAKPVTVTNGKIQNVSLVTETERSINDVLGFSALITLVKPDNTTSIAACVNLIPHTSDLRIWTALFKGPNVVGNVYFLQLHSTVRMIQFLNNANRGVNVEPLDWALVGQWDKQADSYDNPDRCDGNALRERQQASLYNNTDDTEGIRIVGNPNVIPINFDMTSLPEESEFGNGTVLVLSEVPRFSVSKEVLAVGCATVLQLASMVATAEFNNSVNGDLRFYQVSPFHLLQAKLSPLVRQNVSRSQTGRLRFSVLSFPLFMDEPKRVVGLQSQCDLNYLGSPYPPLGNDNSSASFFTLEPQMESVEHLMWIGGFSLFGQRAIVWRSIAINDNIDEWPVDCTTVRPSNRVIFAEAIFHYPVAGRILFAQEYNRPLAATTIQVVLNHMFFNDFTESQWHLYPGKVKEDLDSLVCTNVFGRVLNPDAMDARNCENHLGQNCPMGFLSEKFGPIVINPYEQLINSSVPRSQLLLTDFDLKLIGTNKITEAVVFLDWKWAKACANITIKSPTTARYFVKIGEIIRPVSLEEQYGKKEFLSQSNEDLKDLVFAKPLEGGYKETCDAKELGDPIKVELSQDVIGKSVAFNTSEPGRFQDCSRVDFSPIIDVRSRYGLARIETASLQGYIRFEQPDVGDGQKLPTIIDYHFEMSSNVKPLDWYIANSCDRVCDVGIVNVFNPFFLNDTLPEYPQLCDSSPDYFCMPGDLGKKLGKFTPAVYGTVIDSFLPLFGDYSILDKFLILKNDQPICSCSPITALEMQEMPIFTKFPMTSANLRDRVTESYEPLARWQAVIQPYTKISDSCYKHSLRFMAANQTDLTKFRSHIKSLFKVKGSVFKPSCNSGPQLFINWMVYILLFITFVWAN